MQPLMHRSMRGASRGLVMAAVLALVAAGCTGNRGPDTSVGVGPPKATIPKGEAPSASFGDLASPCGTRGAGTAGGAGPAEQGVTNDKVVIGYGDDAGFSVVPGLSHELSDAMKAMIKWCNAQGGINGRQIEGRYYDAKFTETNNVMQEACGQVFMLVGEGWASDGAAEETRLGCNLPAVPGYSVTAEFANAPLMYQGVPNPIDVNPAAWAAQLAKAFPDKIAKASVMFANFSALIDTKDKALQAFQKFGWKFLDCPQSYGALGEADWRPFAQKLKDCGAQAVNYVGTPYPNFENLLDSAAQVGYKPIWFAEANMYDSVFAKWNTNGNGDNVYVRLAFTPFEEADQNKATKQYQDLVKQNGGDIALLGMQATSSFLLWATAAKDCGSALTRQCVLDNLRKITKWTGGGLHAETNPAENLGPPCGMVMKLQGTKWVRFAPKKAVTFDCSPDYNVKITGRVVDQAQLGPDRVSTKFKKR